MENESKYWLLKAEPDSRIVKGKDVKFSVDDFESIKTSPWEGVRSYEARNLMREMRNGEKALFYHSNCKEPGIAAFAEVSKEAYPDFTAWDPSHPYYDAKSDEAAPRWFMVDLTFKSRASHFVPLALLKYISELSLDDEDSIPEGFRYIGSDGVKALKSMDLVTRGRLSVQRVQEDAWAIIEQLAEKGGWEELDLKGKKGGKKKPATTTKPKRMTTKKSKKAGENEEPSEDEPAEDSEPKSTGKTSRKRKEMASNTETSEGPQKVRRSTRNR